jgi:hypothetical protein
LTARGGRDGIGCALVTVLPTVPVNVDPKSFLTLNVAFSTQLSCVNGPGPQEKAVACDGSALILYEKSQEMVYLIWVPVSKNFHARCSGERASTHVPGVETLYSDRELLSVPIEQPEPPGSDVDVGESPSGSHTAMVTLRVKPYWSGGAS